MPPHMARKGNAFYHVPATGDRKWTALGSDKARALVLWADLEGRTNSNTFDDLFRWFMGQAKLAPNTRRNYETHGNRICGVFGHMAPDSIDTPMLERYKDACKPGSANVRIGIIKTVYTQAIRKGLCRHNPARDVGRLQRVKRTRLINDAEFTNVGAVAADWCRIAMDIIYYIGCRPGDALKIKQQDISDTGILFTAQKTGKQTLYRMTPDLAATIAEAKALPRGVKSLYLLADYRGQPYATGQLRSAWNAACKLANVSGAQVRDIRAKNASDDPAGAQERLQHSDQRQTQTYIRSTPVVSPLPRRFVEVLRETAKKSK